MYKRYFKRVIDLSIVIPVLFLTWPLLLGLILCLGCVNGKDGIFFLQQRSGEHRKLFNIIKFKSMNDKKDAKGRLLPDSMRLTPLGKFIRYTSLDELPQLFNVLKGDMSLVGPRPLLPEYLTLYDQQQARRNEVKPGITGWAQVHGRNNLKLSTRFEYDIWYVDHVSFVLDVKIMWRTFLNLIHPKVVVCREDLVGVDDLNFDERAFKNK